MKRNFKVGHLYLWPFLLFLSLPFTSIAQFGGMLGMKGRIQTELKRKLAPFVVIKNKRIKIIAESLGDTSKDLADVLKTKFETDVLKDLGYVIDDQNPDTILKFSITAFDIEFREGSRKSGKEIEPYTLVNGNVEVSYQAVEAKTNATLDSENLTEKIAESYPPAVEDKPWFGSVKRRIDSGTKDDSVPPSQAQVRAHLIDIVVRLMAQRAAPVEERFPVLLPQGDFKNISKVAQTNSWAKVLLEAEKMTPAPKPKDDSYRYYLIGLANEGLAYDQTLNSSKETDEAGYGTIKAYLLKAREAYDKAKSMHSEEKEYIQPWTRVDKAIAQYDKIKRQAEEYQSYIKNKPSSVPPITVATARSTPTTATETATKPATPSISSPAEDVLDNKSIIKLWKEDKVKESLLIQLINNSPTHQFDPISVKGLRELVVSGVPEDVINAMIEKVKAGKPKTPAPAPRRKKS